MQQAAISLFVSISNLQLSATFTPQMGELVQAFHGFFC